MSVEQMPLSFPALAYVETQTGRTVSGPVATKIAHAADIVALARPTKTVRVDNAVVGTYRVGFTRSSPDITLMRLTWWYRAHISVTAGDSLAVALTIDDGTYSVGPVNALIPAPFQGSTTLVSLAGVFTNPAGMTLGGEGWLDLDAIAGTLTASDDWTFTFAVTRPVGTIAYVDRIEGWEVPRGTVDNETGSVAGALAGPLAPGNPVSAGSTTTVGWERIAETLYAGAHMPVEYLSLDWINDITADIPQTASTTYAALTHFEETAGVPIVFRVRARPMTMAAPPGTNAGEPARFRVLYYVAGGGTGDVQLSTGSAASPYTAAGLTGAAWTWSPWVACALPTDGTDQVASLSFTAQVTTGTIYLGAVVVESAP